MTRTLTETQKATAGAPQSGPPPKPTKPAEGNRETIESLVVAGILAVLIRGFVAEAFVIPTGSMAPTLMGRHKDVRCPQCDQQFTVNVPGDDAPRRFDSGRDRPELGLCANCRVPVDVANAPSFKGDRILVMKFPYEMPFLPGAARPQRWDVIVFKFPGNPDQSYIKRLVGLPGDELMVRGGDIFVRRSGTDDPFTYARKPLSHQRAMQMLVYDDAHRPKALNGKTEWRRWAPSVEGAWSEPQPGTFEAAASDDWVELGYRHLVPTPWQWDDLLNGRSTASPRPVLITDNYSYNSAFNDLNQPWDDKPHWVGDLTVSCRIDVKSATGSVALELVRGGVPYRCEIDLATGQAVLSQYGAPVGSPLATTLRGAGSYDVSFANVDGRLTLWVDGRPQGGEGIAYDEGELPRPIPTEADLRPVRVAARGAKVQVSRLLLERDIYYTERPKRADYLRVDRLTYDDADLASEEMLPNDPKMLHDLLGDPARFGALSASKGRTFPIASDKYMMMGDNSPESYDGREWNDADRDWDTTGRNTWEVPESMIVGRAFFVYWPHGKPFWPNIAINRDFIIPFRPNVERMKWVR